MYFDIEGEPCRRGRHAYVATPIPERVVPAPHYAITNRLNQFVGIWNSGTPFALWLANLHLATTSRR